MRIDGMRVEDVELSEIAESFGTPCYVYSQAKLESGWNAYATAFSNLGGSIYYSVKANSNIAILALMAKLGAGFDIVSGGELHRVLTAGGDADKIVFSGVGKSEWEITNALEEGVFCINVESEGELHRVQRVAEQLGKRASIGIRVNPDIDAKTHPHIATGLQEAKFGVPIEQALRLYRKAVQMGNIDVSGVAVHIGSQVLSLEPFKEALERVLDLVESLQSDGISVRQIDLGGGLGVRYRDESPPTPEQYSESIAEVLRDRGVDISVSVEPGRSITAKVGMLLCKVEYIKQSSTKNFAIVDAAMNDLIRPALYDAWMEISAVQDSDEPERIYDVVGPVCETGDFLGKSRKLRIGAGDLLVVRDAGAYGAAMMSNYNSRLRPAEVLVSGNQMHLIRERDLMEDLIGKEEIPSHIL